MEKNNNLLKLFEEIKTIRQIIEILAKDNIIKEIEKFATTKERRKTWNLLDGKMNTSDLANNVNITTRAVQEFIKDLRENGLLIIVKRGYYKRKFDYLLPE
ncbi:MAG: hypothetical protein ACTSVV_01100 [Promethearchaeota archaeon]